MKKTILVVGFLAFIAYVGSKAFVALFGYQSIEKYKIFVQPDAAVSYSWLSSDLGGVLEIHDLVITPYKLKRTYYIDRVRLYFEDYPRMLIGLLMLKDGDWSPVKRFQMEGVRAPLEGRDLEEFLALEFGKEFEVPLGLYACGTHRRVNHEVLSDMGINELHADWDIALDTGERGERVSVSMGLNMHELGKLESLASIQLPAQKFEGVQALIDGLKLYSLQVSHVDSGYFRRLSNYCGGLSGLERDDFALMAAQGWQQSMRAHGLVPGAGLIGLYQDYLRLGGTVTISAQDQSGLGFRDFSELIGQNLVERLNIQASINGRSVALSQLQVQEDYFVQRNAPPPVPASDKNADMEAETPVVEKAFRDTALDQLENYLGYRVNVTSLEGKEISGLIDKIEKQTLTIAQPLQGGSVAFSIRLEEIGIVEVWR